VLVGFYNMYKNVPLLQSVTACLWSPFAWVESCNVVTQIWYLGTILFLRNLRWLLRAATGAVLARADVRPVLVGADVRP
jgi:hypothetical protein